MSMMKKVNDYGILLDSLNLSPFETLNALNLRTNLEKEMNNITNQEKLKLYQHDLYLLDNIKDFKDQLEQVYDFSNSDEPIEQWWWHLDKVISGEIVMKGSLSAEKNVAL
ncbi:hypothetical protein CIL05_20905 [Virgibacillus profundi]|uniref:Uncharacterized protein n=1 Tax=Virgibacillus profundi TaxID=2024555 RepID=A0A2A2I8F8_9BACI|nr:hypothetical protein [Virgibacillus profundi]PAV27668.1 hypothetical protein CIL05_20905 [Virgibacillus profundi]PXY51998.1 hypothetical protein CIT14_20040 [Virgibacillus profundi]